MEMITTEPITEDVAVPQPPNSVASKQKELWSKWKADPQPRNMSGVLQSVNPVIDYHLGRINERESGVYRGEAKRLAMDAIKAYNPEAGASLNTHVYNYLRPLARKKEELRHVMPVSREMSKDIAIYNQTAKDLFEETNRDPTDEEIQERTGIPSKKLIKIRQSMKGEIPESSFDGFDSGEDTDNKIGLWTEYVYHDLDPDGKKILEFKTGRNGKEILTNEEIALRLGIDTSTVSRRSADIADRILKGSND